MNDYDSPLIRVLITALAGGLYKVTTPDSGATIVDRTRNPFSQPQRPSQSLVGAESAASVHPTHLNCKDL